jgi:hypothetical protein
LYQVAVPTTKAQYLRTIIRVALVEYVERMGKKTEEKKRFVGWVVVGELMQV